MKKEYYHNFFYIDLEYNLGIVKMAAFYRGLSVFRPRFLSYMTYYVWYFMVIHAVLSIVYTICLSEGLCGIC